ncbi:hypothetical protein CGGC5_v014001 [Colletotrichum fructicola Nara gc5]|uniref:Uncharacterized protein n=1 Tax=Colletotrichum fructicola (strain Nara gc5) TaxID=1213859 RepID=A0A7J6INA6_COLFN|nr:hypothetical protein CGGC5_v014001 [Colletotrichum fructicola Nara gc5]
MVHLSYLSPVSWKETTVDAKDGKACAQVLSILRTFEPSKEAHAHPKATSAGRIIVAYDDILRIIFVMGAVAAHDQRPLLELDLLDLPQNQEQLFPYLEIRLDMAARLGGLIVLHNFASLVARRSFDKPERCQDITRFIDFIEVFSGIVILCLETNDLLDGKLRKLRPVYIDIDDAAAV